MQLELSAEHETFRDEVRAFARDVVPAGIKDKVRNKQRLTKSDYIAYQKLLDDKGWAVPGWPEEGRGQRDWCPVHFLILDEELALAGCPRKVAFGFSMVGPVIAQFGNDAQKRQHLPKIKNSEVWWCQGFSEPGSGSDLASLRTRAIRDGDHYVVNGQKVWTTMAQHADWMFNLVRTDPDVKQQEGISFLLVDMNTPGITVRPIITIDGSHEVNEVFFEDVRVPVENLIGEENKGWTYAKFLLSYERSGIAGVGACKFQLGLLKEAAKSEQTGGQSLIDNPRFRSKVADIEMRLMGLDAMNTRIIATSDRGKVDLGDAAMLKIRGTEIQQRLFELIMEAAGPGAVPYQGGVMSGQSNEPPIGGHFTASAAPIYFNWRKASIYGGSNEIQKNIIAKAVLGL